MQQQGWQYIADVGADHYLLAPQFTLADGRHIVFDSGTASKADPGVIRLFSKDYSYHYDGSTFNYRPYPTQGIDQNPFTKTVCYAEYNQDVAETASVWRSTNYTDWTPVLTVNARGHATPEIRHWHMVTADPYVSGHWYAWSGDDIGECHIWKSTDDALTWTKIVENDNRVRAVGVQFNGDYIYWFEDNINGGFFRLAKNTNTVETIIASGVLSGIGYSTIQTPFGYVGFYDKRAGALDEANSYVYLVDFDLNYHQVAKFPDRVSAFKSRFCSAMTGEMYSHVTPESRDGWPSRLLTAKIIHTGDGFGLDMHHINSYEFGFDNVGITGYNLFALEHYVNTNRAGFIATNTMYAVLKGRYVFKKEM